MAKKGKVMVVVLQYRLNILGLIPPPVAPSASDPNLQVRDVILGLKEIKKNLGWQGDMGKVTVGGQSTGASLIRGEYSWSPSLARPADASIVGRPRGPRPVPADDSPV
jgi:carboxylesterase type B